MSGRHRSPYLQRRLWGSGRDVILSVAAFLLIGLGAAVMGLSLTNRSGPPQPPSAAAGVLPVAVAAGADPSPTAAGRKADARPSHSSIASPSAAAGLTPRLALPAAQPLWLRVPVIHLAAQLGTVGLNPDSTVEVPAGPAYDRPAWYRYSPTPGEVGPAVIVGHVDRLTHGPSVFYQLGRLQPGDQIYVTRADARVAVFTVNAVRRYPKSAFPAEAVYGNLDYAGLRLVTCGGDFDRGTGHYRDDVVAFAQLTGEATRSS